MPIEINMSNDTITPIKCDFFITYLCVIFSKPGIIGTIKKEIKVEVCKLLKLYIKNKVSKLFNFLRTKPINREKVLPLLSPISIIDSIVLSVNILNAGTRLFFACLVRNSISISLKSASPNSDNADFFSGRSYSPL